MLLSICLPTYNRPKKAFNLILAIDAYLKINNLHNVVEFIVSDNSDNKELNDAIIEAPRLQLSYHKQKQNIGYDNNILFLKKIASGEYIFYISDDDAIDFDIFADLLNKINEFKSDIYILNWGYYKDKILVNINENMGLHNNKYSLGSIINYPLFYFLSGFCFRNIKTDFKNLKNTIGVQMELIYNFFNPDSKVTVLENIYIIKNDQVEVGTGCTVVQDWIPPLGFLRIKNKYRGKFAFKTPVVNTLKFGAKLTVLKIFDKNYSHLDLKLLYKNLFIAIKELL